MLKLVHVRIENYRSCVEMAVTLTDFTPLVGYNNGGKTNIMTAMKWLLRPSKLSKEDFYDPDRPVVITGRIEGIDEDVLAGLVQKHKDRIQPFCEEKVLQIRVEHPPLSETPKKPRLLVRNPAVKDEQSDDAWQANPTGIPEAIKGLFPEPVVIPAMQNVPEDVAKAKAGTTIQNLLAQIVGPIIEKHGTSLSDALDDIGKLLTAEGKGRAKELSDFDTAANEKIDDLFPGVQLRIHIPPPDLNDLFKSGTIRVNEVGFTDWRNVETLGHGAQRTIQMALIRYLAEMRNADDAGASRTLLLIDEPELYLHPQAVELVRLALKDLSSKGYQVVFSTHSPQLIRDEDIANAIIVRKTVEKGTHTIEPLVEAVKRAIADGPAQMRTLMEFEHAAQVLFSERIVLAEGTTEIALLPHVYKKLRSRTLEADKIGIVRLGGSGSMKKAREILISMRLDVKGIVDLDFAFKVAPKAGLLGGCEADLVKAAQAISVFQNANTDLELDNDGWPKNSGERSAAEWYRLLAKEKDLAEIIGRLHAKLLEAEIWLWKLGDIEAHLGIQGSKGERAWAEYRSRLLSCEAKDVVADLEEVKKALKWLGPAAATESESVDSKSRA